MTRPWNDVRAAIDTHDLEAVTDRVVALDDAGRLLALGTRTVEEAARLQRAPSAT
ncbi:hypothetical protein [Actinomadura algeriensis]|uniref:Uncharacterized protein n=1 Tax=Actinomadura algeriensis TaxID=1679523 RepID=A0ABR9K3V7_9ACTN|nr:hypothetical protein [Actinomadura algeriensis]MBE1537531.1 hypothetical protein [Actinomadura algeriensis]